MNVFWVLFYATCSLISATLALWLAAKPFFTGDFSLENSGLVFALMGASVAFTTAGTEKMDKL